MDKGSLADGSDGIATEAAPLSHRIQIAVFSVAADVNKDLSIHPFFAVLLMVIDAIQMIGLGPLNPDPALPFYDQPLMRSIWQALQPVFFQPSPRDAPPGGVYYHAGNIFIIAFVWTLSLGLLYAFATYLAMQEDDPVNDYKAYRPRWPSQLLRAGLRLMQLGLYVPVLLSLLEPLKCSQGSVWSNTNIQCFTDLHAFYLVAAVITVPIAFLLTAGAAAIMIDRRPDPKRNLLSQPHGRIALLMVLVKTVLCLIFAFALDSNVSQLFPLLTALAAGLLWMVAYARYLPFHQQWLNEVQCGLAGVYVAGCVAAVLSAGLTGNSREPSAGGDAGHSSTGTWTFLFTAPLAAFVGWAFALMSKNSYNGRRELGSPYAVELKARSMLAELLADEASSGSGGSLGSLGMGTGHRRGSLQTGGGHHHGAHSGGGAGTSSVALSDTLARRRDIQMLYDDAGSVFSASSLLELFTATYLGTVMRNRHLENVHLRAAVAKADTSAFDIKFFVWERYAIIEADEAASNSVRTSVIRRLQFDTLQAESEKLCMKLRALILDFWTECCEKRPDMNRMQSIGIEIIATIRRCENVYKQMMELSPGSAAVMRSYADFLLEIANNPKQALELLALAEQIEEEESKAHATDNDTADYPLMSNQPDFDLSHESVSLLRIEGTPGKVGIILDVNNAALKLFGYTRREVVGKNINDLVPEPMSTPHDKFLHRYIETGEERVVNSSRIYYGLHKAGFVFPMCANVRPMENGFGAVFESITTSQAYVVFMGDAARWKVTAACKASMTLLNLSVDDIRAGAVTIDRILPSMMEGLPSARKMQMQQMQGMDLGMEDDAFSPEHRQGGPGGVQPVATFAGMPLYHSPIMTELIAAAGTPSAGVDVALQVIDWRRALSVQAKVNRKQSMLAFTGTTDGHHHHHHKHGHGRTPSKAAWASPGGSGGQGGEGGMTSPRDIRDIVARVEGADREQNAQSELAALQAEVAAAFQPTRSILATAKLQELPLAFIPTPVYVLRWRLSKEGESGPAGGDDDGGSTGSADSNEVQNSDDGGSASGSSSGSSSSDEDEDAPLVARDKRDKLSRRDSMRKNRTKVRVAGSSSAGAAAAAPAPITVPAAAAAGSGLPKSAMKQAVTPVSAANSSTSSATHSNISSASGPGGNKGGAAAAGTGGTSATPKSGTGAQKERRSSVSFGPPPGVVTGAPGPTQGRRFSASLQAGQISLLPGAVPEGPASPSSAPALGPSASAAFTGVESPASAPAPLVAVAEGAGSGLTVAAAQPGPDGQGQGLDRKSSKGRIKWSTEPDGIMEGQGGTTTGGQGAEDGPGGGRAPGSRSSDGGAPEGSGGDSARLDPMPSARGSGGSEGAGGALVLLGRAGYGPPELPAGEAVEGALVKHNSHHSHKDGHGHRKGGKDEDAGSGHRGSHAGSQGHGEHHHHHKAKSATSGSSSGSSHVTDALRKGISMRSREMEGSLVALRRALILVFLVVGAVNIASTAVTTSLFSQLIKATDFVALNGERGIALQRAYNEIELLRYAAVGVVSTVGRPTLVSDSKARLTEALEKLDRLHRELYIASTEGSTANSRAAELWKTPFVHVEDAVTDVAGLAIWNSPGDYQYTNRSINLGDAGLEFIIKGRQIVKTAVLSDLSMTNPLVFWTLHNGPLVIRDAFNTSMLVAQDLTQGQATIVSLVNIIVLAVALGLQFIMVVFVMMPAVRKVLKQKTSVFNVFLSTPLVILRSLRAKTESRIANLRRAAEELEAGMDIAGAGDMLDGELGVGELGMGNANLPPGRFGGGDGGGGAVGYSDGDGDSSSYGNMRSRPVDAQLAAVAASIAAKGGSNGSGDRDSRKSSGIFSFGSKRDMHTSDKEGTAGSNGSGGSGRGGQGQHGGKPHHHHHKSRERRFRSSSASTLCDSRTLRFLLPMLVLVAYYYGTYMWKQSVVTDSEYYKSEVFYSHQVAFMVGQSDYNIRNLASTCDHAFNEDQAHRFARVMATLQSIQDGLLYGDPVRQLRPLLTQNPSYFKLMMENGCLPPASNGNRYTEAECTGSFFDGLVGRGLQAALKEYIQLASRISQARQDADDLPVCTTTDFLSGNTGLAANLAERFLAPGLRYAAGLTVDATHASLNGFMTLDVAVTCASIAGLLLFFFGIYNPMIRRMDAEIKNVRHLLLLYPDEISAAVPAIIQAGRDLLKDGHSSSNSSTVSGGG